MAETRASADTSNIDDLIRYIESPEYLRMTARQQDESPGALLSSSTTQPWLDADGNPFGQATPYPRDTEVTVITDRAWSSPLMAGDIVRVQFCDIAVNPEQTDSLRVIAEDGGVWWLGFSDVRLTTDEDREAAAARASGPFGIQWNTANQRCECASCNQARDNAGGVSSPAVTRIREGERPLNLTTRTDFTTFATALRERRAFATRGALRGVLRPEEDSPGYLSVKFPAAASLWRADLPKIDYVVYSYRTPIAYHVAGPNYNEWIYPDVSYSRTTSKHQSKIKAALLVNEGMGANVRWLREED